MFGVDKAVKRVTRCEDKVYNEPFEAQTTSSPLFATPSRIQDNTFLNRKRVRSSIVLLHLGFLSNNQQIETE